MLGSEPPVDRVSTDMSGTGYYCPPSRGALPIVPTPENWHPHHELSRRGQGHGEPLRCSLIVHRQIGSVLLAMITPHRRVGSTDTGKSVDAVHPPQHGPLLDRFRAVLLDHADRPAVITGSEVVSYTELGRRCTDLAAALTRSGAGFGGRVGLLTGHGSGTVVAVIGAMLAGLTPVVLDTGWPAGRLTAMAGSAGIGAVVVGDAHRSLVHVADGVPIIPLAAGDPIDSAATDISAAWDVAVHHRPWPDEQPAYVNYTSGSTGTPKAVAQTQAAVLQCAENQMSTLSITATDRLTLLTSFGYDMAVVDLWSALCSGAALVPYDVAQLGLRELPGLLTTSGVTIYHSTPTVFRYLLELIPEPLSTGPRVVLLGGERSTPQDIRRGRQLLGGQVTFVNGYGSTEASFSCQHQIPPGAEPGESTIPLGRPLPGYTVRLLDEHGAEDPSDGQIEVRSRAVAPGYDGDPVATDAQFTEHSDGSRSYLTGDLGHRRTDGILEYRGRRDRQVKVRGFRVEPSEIEGHAESFAGVGRAAVIARLDARGETELVGFLQPAAGAGIDVAAVRRHLLALLPAPMVPTQLRVLSELPLTVTGKVDTPALATDDGLATDVAGPGPLQAAGSGDAPRTPTEALVHSALARALGRNRLARDRHFFELGAHSLHLAQLHADLSEQFDLTFVDLFAHSSVAELAAHLDARAGSVPPPDRTQDDRTAADRRAAIRRDRQQRRRAAQ